MTAREQPSWPCCACSACEARRGCLELETRIAETTGRIQNLEAWLRRCEAGDTVCPTCGQPLPEVPEEKIEAEKAILKHMKSDVAIATRALATARQAETEYAGKQATYAAETKALEATIVAASAELTALAIDKAVILTEDQLAPYEETVSAYDVASAQLSAATSKAAKLQALLATSESRRSKLESQIAVYREQLSGFCRRQTRPAAGPSLNKPRLHALMLPSGQP